tara:strand:- start:3695 stop:3871 length:177 start_codon:yes stop_codon:yes gene_type:complete
MKNIIITKELLDLFKTLFPNNIPTKRITAEDISFLQGQQSVINRMDFLYDDENQVEEV